MNKCIEEYDYCDDDMNQHIIVTEIPALKSPRDDRTERSQLQEIYLSSRFDNNKPEPSKSKVTHYIEKRDKKLQSIKEQMENKLMSQCTFKPQTTNKSQVKRNLNEFLSSQEQHKNKVEEKRNKLKKELQAKTKQPFKPKINEKGKTSKTPAYERLYHRKEFEQENNQSFKPEIQKKSKSIIREIPVEELLYKDAIRRTGKQKNAVIKEKGAQLKNCNTEKLVAQKFIKEFYYILEDLELLEKKQIGFDQFKIILRALGMLSYEDDSQSELAEEERILSDEAFFVIEDFGVTARNICVLLLAIMGIFNINPIHFGEDCGKKNFDIDEVDGRKLQKHFDFLYRNKLSNESKIKKQQFKIEQYSHHPQINYLSTEMAERYRQKMITKANKRFEANNLNIVLTDRSALTHQDLLVIDNMGKNLELSQMKEQKDKTVDKQCTFHPKTNNHQKSVEVKVGMEKSLELYEYAQIKKEKFNEKQNQLKSQEKSVNKYQNKSKRKSPLNRPSDKMNEKNNLQNIKNVDKTLERMFQGRKIREEKNKYLVRGEPNSQRRQKQSTVQSELASQRELPKTQRREPYIVIDVNMEDETQQIEFFNGDERNINGIVSQFCEKHNLDAQSQQQLYKMVEKEIEYFLNNIGIESTHDFGI